MTREGTGVRRYNGGMVLESLELEPARGGASHGAPTRRILVVEDSEDLAFGLKENLALEGYNARVAPDGETGLEMLDDFHPDLVILDLMLPGIGGYEFLSRFRDRGREEPVLILSARDEQIDKLRGFRMGADDYVTKPFDLFELLARVDAILRRTLSEEAEVIYRFADVTVDQQARTVYQSGEEVELSPKEFDLLVSLLKRQGTVVSREDLLKEVWHHKARVRTRTVDTHILHLRKKLEPDPADPRHFVTVPKVGYRFEP